MYVAFIVLSCGLLVHGQTATETIPLSSYVQTTQPAVTPEVAQCVTFNRFSKLDGLCVTRARCDYGTAAIDSTLYKPRGAKSPCPSDKVCCPNHYIIPDTPPKDDSNRSNQNGIHSSESNLSDY